MDQSSNDALVLIAGKGKYPLVLAESARAQGVQRIVAIAFKRETDPQLTRLVDEIHWLYVGQLQAFLDRIQDSGIPQAVMAGQITPSNLFNLRPDKAMRTMLAQLSRKNADTLFGAIADQLQGIGVELKAASLFMESCMPAEGVLTSGSLAEAIQTDIQVGRDIARECCRLNIGQTVVIKDGAVLAVEAFEGTDQAILRGGKLGGAGAVVVKVAGPGHDMRFDIPVIGDRTLKTMKKAGIQALAIEAGRAILLGVEDIRRQAEAQGLAILVMPPLEQENPG